MKKFKHIIENYSVWDDKILKFVREFFNDKTPEFLDDTKAFYNQKQIYILFSKNYNELVVRFDTQEKFINALQLMMLEYLPQLYVSTLAFVNDEFQKLLSEENRGDIQKGTTFGTSKQKNKQGVPPSNLKIKDDLADLNIKNAEFMENFNKADTSAQVLNLLGNLKQIINSKITSKIFEWLNNFNKLFTNLVCDEFNWTEQLTDILYELREKVYSLVDIIDANKLQDLYNELQVQFHDLKDELDKAIENATHQNITNLQATVKALETKFNIQIGELWDYLNANDGLLLKFEELYNQTKTENEQLEARLNAKILENTNLINGIDKNNIAYKNQHNNFTNNQTITGDTAFIQFKKGTTRKGYIGKAGANSDNIVLHSENGDLVLKASQNVRLEVGARNGVIGERAPTANNHLTNKKYVDDKIQQEITNINGLDTTNLAKTNERNTFLEAQKFNKGFQIGDGSKFINVNGEALLASVNSSNVVAQQFNVIGTTPTFNDNSCVTKKYVDDAIVKFKKYNSVYFEKTLTLHKSDVVRGLWAYKIVESSNYNVFVSGSENKRLKYKLTVLKYGNNVYVGQLNNYYETTISDSGNLNVSIVGENNWVLSGTDLYSGSAGRFNGKVRFLLEYWY